MRIKTKTKIKIAGAIFRLIKLFVPSLVNKPDLIVSRNRIKWKLNLSEGIDLSIFIFGCFEKDTSSALKRIIQPTNHVLDIGANVGAHALPIASLLDSSGRVLAIEPTQFAYTKLLDNLKLNPNLANRINTYQLMLVKNNSLDEKSELYSSWPVDKEQDSRDTHGGVLKSTVGCSKETLDEFCGRLNIEKLDVIKLDVDGSEAAVIDGGRKTLQKFHPVIVMELAPYVYENYNEFLSLISLLKKYNYSFYHLNGKKIKQSIPDEIEYIIPPGASLNVIAK